MISGYSIHVIGVDHNNLATKTARNMWYFSTDLQGAAKGGLVVFFVATILLNILPLTFLTEEQLKPYMLHKNSSITSNNSGGIPHDKPNSWNPLINLSFLTIFLELASFPLVKNDETESLPVKAWNHNNTCLRSSVKFMLHNLMSLWFFLFP